uniref:Secreted protein n=1 Tax=Heterorhabditis bacteriophora TaxID=37862 RepID=A0A1I7WS83_HETBA
MAKFVIMPLLRCLTFLEDALIAYSPLHNTSSAEYHICMHYVTVTTQ